MTRLLAGVACLVAAAALAVTGLLLVRLRIELDPFEEPYGDA